MQVELNIGKRSREKSSLAGAHRVLFHGTAYRKMTLGTGPLIALLEILILVRQTTTASAFWC